MLVFFLLLYFLSLLVYVCFFVFLYIHPFVRSSVRLSVHLSVCRFVRSLLFPFLCHQPVTLIHVESQREHIKLPWSFILSFVVTEKVWESESTDASDDDIQITNDPPVNEKRPSPAKKANKKAHTDMKSKSTKQASLTSFFKKS